MINDKEDQQEIVSSLISDIVLGVILEQSFLPQLDGNYSSEYSTDSDEETSVSKPSKRARIESDSSTTDSEEPPSASNRMSVDSSDESEGEEYTDASRRLLNKLRSKVIFDQNGRAHVQVPGTGPSVVFYKSNRAKPSSISRHVDDIIT